MQLKTLGIRMPNEHGGRVDELSENFNEEIRKNKNGALTGVA